MRVAILFDRFGPYHVARIKGAAKYCSVLPVEFFEESKEYQWDKVNGLDNRITLFPNRAAVRNPEKELYPALQTTLNRYKPDAVAINGWSDKGALAALSWCLKNGVPAVVMSESTLGDENRVAWKEWIKRQLIKLYASGLVGGVRHVRYLEQLGMDGNVIFTGYDVIDNSYFQTAVKTIRHSDPAAKMRLALPDRYFLASSRFIEKKNLFRLITAYAQYRAEAPQPVHDLVILGDGELRHALLALIHELQIQEFVHLPGFLQYHQLPYFYAFASVFIHASTSEQWGLVVNEAMAAGLPVLVSERCGCAPELVATGINGCTFDPWKIAALAEQMKAITASERQLEEMGRKSAEIIAGWQPDHFGKGLKNAVEAAAARPVKKSSLTGTLLLNYLIYR